MCDEQNDDFLFSLRGELPDDFARTLYRRLNEQEQGMMLHAKTNHRPIRTANPPAPIRASDRSLLAVAVAIAAIAFFGVIWFGGGGSSLGIFVEQIDQPEPPQPEHIYRLGDYGMYLTAAFDEANDAIIIVTTTGVFRHTGSDLRSEPERLSDEIFGPTVNASPLRDGNRLLFREKVGYASYLVTLDVETGAVLDRFYIGDGTVFGSDQLSAEGTRYHALQCEYAVTISSQCDQHLIRTWDIATGDLLDSIPSAGANFHMWDDGAALLYTPDGERVVRRDAATGDEDVLLIAEDGATISAVAMSDDGEMIAVAKLIDSIMATYPVKEEFVRVYRLDDLNALPLAERADAFFRSQPPRQVLSEWWPTSRLTFSPDGEQLLTDGHINGLRITGVSSRAIDQTTGNVHQIILDGDGERAIVARNNGEVQLVDIQANRRLSVTNRHITLAFVPRIMLSDDGTIWMAYVQTLNGITRWGFEDGQPVSAGFEEAINTPARPDHVQLFSVSEDGRLAAYTLNNANQLFVHDNETRQYRQFQTLLTGRNHFLTLDFAGTERIVGVATLSDTGVLYVYDVETGDYERVMFDERALLRTPDYYVLAVDETTLFYTVCMVEVSTNICPAEAEESNLIFFDDLTDLRRVVMPTQRIESIPYVAYTPAASHLLIAECVEAGDHVCSTGGIMVWDVAALREGAGSIEDAITADRADAVLIDYTFDGQPRSIAVHPNVVDGSGLVAVQDNTTTHILHVDFTTGAAQLRYTLDEFNLSLGFSADGAWLLGAKAGYLDVWALP